MNTSLFYLINLKSQLILNSRSSLKNKNRRAFVKFGIHVNPCYSMNCFNSQCHHHFIKISNKTRPYISVKPEVFRKTNYFNGGHGSELTAKRCSAYAMARN